MKKIKKAKKQTMLAVAHDMAKGLYDAGIIDTTTLRELDVLRLQPVKQLSPKEIKTSACTGK